MVKNREEYSPQKFYSRKLLRSVLRSTCERKYGHHNVSRNMAYNFKQLKKGE